MKQKTRSLLRWSLGIFLVSLVLSFLLTVRQMNMPGAEFIGSPPRKNTAAPQRSTLNLRQGGDDWMDRFWKAERPTSPYAIWGPALWATPIVHYLVGWDILADDLCLRGILANEYIAKDGDINYLLALPPEYAQYASRHPEDKPGQQTILVEIPLNIRRNFPVLPDVALGDSLSVCGRYVFDRNHGGWTEIHPARWIEIIEPKP